MMERLNGWWRAKSGRILDHENRINWGKIDTGMYSKGWIIIFADDMLTK